MGLQRLMGAPECRVQRRSTFRRHLEARGVTATVGLVSDHEIPVLAMPIQVTLEPVDQHSREECIALEVLPEQRMLIATNERSLAQAAARTAFTPMTIRCDGELVGFLMYEPRSNRVALLHRFMVDWRHQRRGIGLLAMRQLVELLSDRGFETIYLSFRPENLAARRLYSQLGFVEQEIESDGEVLCRLGPHRPIDACPGSSATRTRGQG